MKNSRDFGHFVCVSKRQKDWKTWILYGMNECKHAGVTHLMWPPISIYLKFSKCRLSTSPVDVKFSSIWIGFLLFFCIPRCNCSLPVVELQHLLSKRGQKVLAVDSKRTDVQNRKVSWKLLEQRAAACIPHLRRGGKREAFRDQTNLIRLKPALMFYTISVLTCTSGLTMVELEASSPAHTSVPVPSGLLKTAFLVSNLQEEPALNVCTVEQEQLGSWVESCRGVWVRAIRMQRSDGFERPATSIHYTYIQTSKPLYKDLFRSLPGL